MITEEGRVPVHFWGGPADGAVYLIPEDELPEDSLCRHPSYPDAEYILFKKLADGKLVARYAK